MNGWIGVDLDGTLAKYDHWVSPEHIGEPIPVMVERVKEWLAEGKDVRIFTARVYCPEGSFFGFSSQAEEELWMSRVTDAGRARAAIIGFCLRNFGKELPVTCTKDYGMVELWDDRCVQVVPNRGYRADGKDVIPWVEKFVPTA